MRPQAGFTLVELMAATVMLSVFAALLATLGVQARREHATTTGYQQDVAQWRSAVSALTRDARSASAVSAGTAGVELRVDGAPVDYRVADGALWRGDRRVAERIEAVAVTHDDGLVRFTLWLSPRAAERAPVPMRWVVRSRVAPSAGGER